MTCFRFILWSSDLIVSELLAQSTPLSYGEARNQGSSPWIRPIITVSDSSTWRIKKIIWSHHIVRFLFLQNLQFVDYELFGVEELFNIAQPDHDHRHGLQERFGRAVVVTAAAQRLLPSGWKSERIPASSKRSTDSNERFITSMVDNVYPHWARNFFRT